MTSPSTLYAQLINLCASTKAFHFRDFPSERPGVRYRIFSYYLTSYSDFMKPGALECRGSMFYVSEDGEYLGIACRTPKKFFNLGENPMTMDLSLENPILVMKKEDGSLMSTYLDVLGNLKLKSKASTSSPHCLEAMALLNQNPGLKADLEFLAKAGFTVNLEWTSPDNRIVVPYDESSLVGLSVIDNKSGDVHSVDFVEHLNCQHLVNAWVEDFLYEGDLAEVVKQMSGEEGVVCVTSSGVTCKIKSAWYSALHQNLSSIDSAKGVVEIVLMERSDDLKSMFKDNASLVHRINAFEAVVSEAYNATVSRIYAFHESHKHLGRKAYAMAAKDYWKEGREFALQMSALCGKDFSGHLKSQMIRNACEYENKVLEAEACWRITKVDPDAFLPSLDQLENETRTLH